MIHLKRLYAHNFKQLQEIDLRFPDHARVLVQGKNEAGKSTLFEALYFALFGNALATESGARGLDDLIRYGVEKARVELDVQAGAREFRIRRTITRGKSNVWELDLVAGENVEELRGNTVINKRLIAELGFDGDALLNTCFVEQKKLEKLEGLSKAKREESLAKLLNLDALVQIESDLKIRGEDKQDLDRLKQRADLAEIQAELPAHEEKLGQVEQQLRLIDLRGAVNGAAEELRAVQKLDAAIAALAAQRDSAAQTLARIDALKEAMLNVKDARDAVERVADNAREIERLKQEQANARRAAETIPSLQSRGAELHRVTHALTRLDQIRAARERYAQRAQQLATTQAQLAATQTRQAELQTTITREESARAELETQTRRYVIGEILGEWIAAQHDAAQTRAIENTVAEKRAARDQLAQRFRVQVYGFAALLILLVAAGAIAMPFIAPLAIGLFLLAALVVAAFAIRALNLWRDVSRAAEALGQAEGEARASETIGTTQTARLRDIEAQLAQNQVAIPATPDHAQSARVIIARELNQHTQAELDAELAATRQRLANACAVLGELQQQNATLDANAIAAERAHSERMARQAELFLAAWQNRLQANAQALGVTLEPTGLHRAQYQLDAEIAQIQRRAVDAQLLTQEMARRAEQAQAFWARARQAYEQAAPVKANAAAWHEEMPLDAYTAFGKELRAEYDALGGETAIKQARDIEGNLGRRQGERATRARNAELLLTRVRELFGQAAPLSTSPTLAEMDRLVEQLRQMELGDDATLRVHHRDLVGRVHSLRDRQAQLERDLGLAGVALERGECRQAWIDAARHQLVRERGAEIVSVARRRLVQKVLPATMDYMRQILPTLTRDRYHDAQLDPESYKIQVWDERAADGGAFKEKNIFSGGTKDQFSLALRLAFALATLPQNRGTAPSFIFLDEPLGSFDDERANALIDLLTEGEIARAFDQIFLISHVQVDERLFTHRLVLENGRVAQTDLPIA